MWLQFFKQITWMKSWNKSPNYQTYNHLFVHKHIIQLQINKPITTYIFKNLKSPLYLYGHNHNISLDFQEGEGGGRALEEEKARKTLPNAKKITPNRAISKP